MLTRRSEQQVDPADLIHRRLKADARVEDLKGLIDCLGETSAADLRREAVIRRTGRRSFEVLPGHRR